MSSAAASFYSLRSPALLDWIQRRLRVQWHYDRDDQQQIGAPDRSGQMRGGCHAIVHMQVAEQPTGPASLEERCSQSQATAAASSDTKEADSRAHKKHKRQHLPSHDTDSATAAGAAAAAASSLPSPTAPALSESPQPTIRDLDAEPLDFVLSHVLTPAFLSRATIVIPHSARWHALFYSYYRLFIAEQQSQHVWRTDGCPVWLYQFDLNLFNYRLKALKHRSASGSDECDASTSSSITICKPLPYTSPFAVSLERTLVARWHTELLALQVDLASCPTSFPIFIANYSNECVLGSAAPSDRRMQLADGAQPSNSAASEPWVGDLLVFPLRTIHAVLDSDERGQCVRLKFYLGVYSHYPVPPEEERCPTGFCVAHGPDRAAARAFERAYAEGEGRLEVQRQWTDVRLDEAAWKLWQGNDASSNSESHTVSLPAGVQVQLTEKKAAETSHQFHQCAQLLSDLQEHSCSLIRGVFPASLNTARGTLEYLHSLMGLPAHFSLTSTRPFHARAFHDARLRGQVGLEARHLRRDTHDQRSTHIQASHGNTAYGALCAPAVEAALFLQPLLHIVWQEWRLGLSTAAVAAGASTSSNQQEDELAAARLYTLEVAYQAPLPEAHTVGPNSNASSSSPAAAASSASSLTFPRPAHNQPQRRKRSSPTDASASTSPP